MNLAPARFYLGWSGLYWHWPRRFGLTIGFLPERWEWGINAAWGFRPDALEGEWNYRHRFSRSLPRIHLCRELHGPALGYYVSSSRWTGRKSSIIGIVIGGRCWIWR